MNCTVPVQHLKVFSKALHTLAKVGDGLYLQFSSSSSSSDCPLKLKTFNCSRSAFLTFTFERPFLCHWQSAATTADEDERDSVQISVKSAVWLFRSLNSLERTAERLEIAVGRNRVVFQLFCKFKIVKRFSVAILENDVADARDEADGDGQHFVASARMLSEAVLNFSSTQEEVSLIATPEDFQMNNYDEGDDSSSCVLTKYAISGAEFDAYEMRGRTTNLTFCLKEMRAFIGFADSFGLSLKAIFSEGGRPIAISLCGPNHCKATLVMATMGDGTSNVEDRGGVNAVSGDKSLIVNTTAEVHNHGDNHSSLSGGRAPKRAKLIFKRCFDATFDPNSIRGTGDVLASDSESD